MPCIGEQDSIDRTPYDPHVGGQGVLVGEIVQEYEKEGLDKDRNMLVACPLF